MECFLCGGKKPPLIKSTRIAAFREASRQREDGLGENISENTEFINCHRSCISSYCSAHHIQRLTAKRKASEQTVEDGKRLRGTQGTFQFREHCLFCGEKCELEPDPKNPNRWKKAYLCRTGDEKGRRLSRENLLKRAEERGDDFGKDVQYRVSSVVGDLHAADARYHSNCCSRFYSNPARKSTTSAQSNDDTTLRRLVAEMKANKDRIWNSIELHERYIELGGRNTSRGFRRILLNSVSEQLHPDLLVLSSQGVAPILVFRSSALAQIQIVDDVDDCFGPSISCLASAIRNECPKRDQKTYNTRLSREEIINECSPTLMALLAAIDPRLDYTLPAAMIGQIVTSIVRDAFTNLQLGLSVLLNRQKKIVEDLHAFGVTTSYQELRRLRCSAASAMASVPRGLANFKSEHGLVQVVADNFDTHISSPNGKRSTHGLAMILTQANQQNPGIVFNSGTLPTIRRLSSNETNAANLSLGEVKVERFTGIKKPQIPREFCLKAIPSLSFLATQQVSLNRIATEDLSFFKQVLSDDPGPEYGGYNTQRARKAGQQPKRKTDLVYSPFLDMLPSEPDTMKTAMVEAQRLTELTGQKWTILTCDQQLYKEVVHIKWNEMGKFKHLIPRLGGMHMIMSFVGAVGYLMAGSGIEEILSSTFSGVSKFLSGKKFPQNVRALRLLAEEILRPMLFNTKACTMAELSQQLAETSAKSNTARLWIECLVEPVFIMMAFIRAEREGDWPLHLFAVHKMLPYFFASGHVNYARYGLYYLRSMQNMPQDIFTKFMKGEHVMRHQDGLWNGVWSDLFIETTYMRYGHGPSGIIGSTLNESTLAIWAFSHSTLAQLANDIDEIKDGKRENVVITHKEERNPRIKEDSDDRKNLRETLSTCIDILDPSHHPDTGIINVFSGRIIDDPSLNAHDAVVIGAAEQQAFESKWPASFHCRIAKKVKNMATSTKTDFGHERVRGSIDTEFIYARAVGVMASKRNLVSIETLFSHELASHPTSLFDEKGDMRVTSKAALKNRMRTMSCSRREESPTVIILDGCAILWTVLWPAAPAKVSDFVTSAVTNLMGRIQSASKSHIVFDRYFEMSTKECCRSLRQKGTSRVFKLSEDSPLPQQNLALKVTENKVQLIEMIVRRLSSMQPPERTEVIITGQEPCPIQMGTGMHQNPVYHEEADVLVAYHAFNEAASGRSVKVVSDDTDVLVILSHHLYKSAGLLDRMKLSLESCSTANLIDINEVVSINKKVMPSLLAAHALTGCDTVSSFAGIGKLTVMKKLEAFQGEIKLGCLSTPFNEVLKSCLKFTALLYGDDSEADLNTIRANCFKKKIAGKRHITPKLSSLPPTMTSFEEHVKRAHFQTALWKAAKEPSQPELDPLDHGWEIHQSSLRPVFGLKDRLPAPDEVLNLVSCNCKTGCSSNNCTCKKSSLTCTSFCKCKGTFACRNPMTVAAFVEPHTSDDEQ